MQTPQLSLFCVVSMEIDVTWLFFPPLSLKGESVSFCAPAHSIHLQSSYLGQSVPFLPGADPRTLLSPSPPTSVSTPVPPANHVLVKKSRVRFPVQEQQLPPCHTPELSVHVQRGLIHLSLNVPDCCCFCSFCPSSYVYLAGELLWTSLAAHLCCSGELKKRPKFKTCIWIAYKIPSIWIMQF